MTDDRWVVLGLAHPRAGWFGDLARWSTTAAIPVDFIKCVSADEVRARLSGGRSYSALLVGGDTTGLDRDLVDSVRSAGAAVLVVGPVGTRDWAELGVAGLLSSVLDRTELLASLSTHATPVTRVTTVTDDHPTETEPTWRGRLIAVTGAHGSGTSIVAMGVAQALASEPSNAAMVVLADLALDAEQALLHDAREVMPGIQELTEAHRAGRLAIDQVRSLTFDTEGRGYHLLLGLRRHRDWTAIRPRAFTVSLEGLLRSYRLVVADVDPDVEGEGLTGSLDVEDRNAMARITTGQADVVLVVGNPTTKGLHALCRTIRSLVAAGVDARRVVPVCNRAPRSPRRRAEAVSALAALLRGENLTAGIGNPVFLAERGDLEDAVRDGVRLPPAFGRQLHTELERALDRVSASTPAGPPQAQPVTPGSLGAWTEEAG